MSSATVKGVIRHGGFSYRGYKNINLIDLLFFGHSFDNQFDVDLANFIELATSAVVSETISRARDFIGRPRSLAKPLTLFQVCDYCEKKPDRKNSAWPTDGSGQ